MNLFIDNYKLSIQENQNSLSPFNSDKQNETFGDSLLNNESEILKSISISPIGFMNQSRPPKEVSIEARPLPKGPFDKIKQLCIEHCENKLVKQFVNIILSGHLEDSADNREEIMSHIEYRVCDKMNSLIEALCRCDKRK